MQKRGNARFMFSWVGTRRRTVRYWLFSRCAWKTKPLCIQRAGWSGQHGHVLTVGTFGLRPTWETKNKTKSTKKETKNRNSRIVLITISTVIILIWTWCRYGDAERKSQEADPEMYTLFVTVKYRSSIISLPPNRYSLTAMVPILAARRLRWSVWVKYTPRQPLNQNRCGITIFLNSIHVHLRIL